jgi:hypothetical protein
MNENYLIIEDNVVTNICVWDGKTETWTPTEGAVAVPQATAKAMIWVWDEDTQTVELKEVIGAVGVGFTYDGVKFTTNLPKPSV